MAGIGVYGMARGVLHHIYCSSNEFSKMVEPFFVPVCVLTGVLACAGNCLSKVMCQKPYPKVRVLWQVRYVSPKTTPLLSFNLIASMSNS